MEMVTKRGRVEDNLERSPETPEIMTKPLPAILEDRARLERWGVA